MQRNFVGLVERINVCLPREAAM